MSPTGSRPSAARLGVTHRAGSTGRRTAEASTRRRRRGPRAPARVPGRPDVRGRAGRRHGPYAPPRCSAAPPVPGRSGRGLGPDRRARSAISVAERLRAARPRGAPRHARPDRRQRAVAYRRPRAGQRAAAEAGVLVEKRALLRRVHAGTASSSRTASPASPATLKVVAARRRGLPAARRPPLAGDGRAAGASRRRRGAAVDPRGDPRRSARRARARYAPRRRATASWGRMSRYRYLFTPLRIGPVIVRNRIVFSAHLTNYAEDGLPTEQHAAYYAARAAGGAGLIITEEHSTHPTDWPYEKLIHGFHPEVVPGYRRITDAVHRHGTPIFAQINHNGGQASGMYTPAAGVGAVAGRRPAVPRGAQGGRPGARSPRSSPATRRSPATARRAASTASSCSARTARSCAASCRRRPTSAPTSTAARSSNRARLLLEIVAAVREAIGRELALGVRLCGDELDRGRHHDRRGGRGGPAWSRSRA